MTIKYWPILLCVLMILASCGPKKEKSFVDVPGPYALPHCSNEERAEVTRKAITEYPFVILEKVNSVSNDRYCNEIRKFISAIDLLPHNVRVQFDRAQKKYNLKIYIAREKVGEFRPYVGDVEPAGIYSRVSGDHYIVITFLAGKKSLWHEIGHFLDQTMSDDFGGPVYGLCNCTDFLHKYTVIDDGDSYFMSNFREGFAEGFSFYISNQVEKGLIGDKSYEKFYPLFKFFDELFLDPKMKINEK